MGRRIIKGLKQGITCCAIWIIYLLEPLPHVNPIDKKAYLVSDGIALLPGLFLSNENPKSENKIKVKTSSWLDYLCVLQPVSARLKISYGMMIH